MNYLLVGNGETDDLAKKVRMADIIVQINACRYAEQLPAATSRFIFITNSVDLPVSFIDVLAAKKERFPHARLILARNASLYRLKRLMLQAKGKPTWKHYRLSKEWEKLDWQADRVSFLQSLSMELSLWGKGMHKSFMPSTGYIAYNWIRSRMYWGDKLDIDGFTFEGWKVHPWDIEKTIVKPFSRPILLG